MCVLVSSFILLWPGVFKMERGTNPGCLKSTDPLGVVKADVIVSLTSIRGLAYGLPYAPLVGEVMLVEPKRESSGDARRDIFALEPRLCQPLRTQKKMRRAIPKRTGTPTPTAIPIIAP